MHLAPDVVSHSWAPDSGRYSRDVSDVSKLLLHLAGTDQFTIDFVSGVRYISSVQQPRAADAGKPRR